MRGGGGGEGGLGTISSELVLWVSMAVKKKSNENGLDGGLEETQCYPAS